MSRSESRILSDIPWVIRRHRLVLLGFIIAAAVGIRLSVVGFKGMALASDTFAYLRMAEAIRLGVPESYFPNGYPLLIALLRTVIPIGEIPYYLVGLNVVLSTGVVGMTYALGREVGTVEVGLLAAAGACVYPNQLNYVRYSLTEVPATFLVVLSLLLFFRRRQVASGITSALAVLIRSSLLPLLGLLLLSSVARSRSIQEATKWAAGAGAVILGYSLLLVVGVVAPSSNMGPNFLIAIESWSHVGVDYTPEGFSAAEREQPLRTYLKTAWNHPAQFLGQRLSSAWELWGPWPYDAEGRRSVVDQLLIGVRFPLLLTAVATGWRWRHSIRTVILLAPALTITAVHVIFFSTPRFTVTAEPPLIVLSALGLWTCARCVRQQRTLQPTTRTRSAT